MASWNRKSLVGDWGALKTAQSSLSTGLTAVKTAFTTIQTLVGAQSLLIPAVIGSIGGLAQAAVTLATSAVTDFLGQGFYVVVCYPQNFDWARAKLREELEELDDEIKRSETAYLVGGLTADTSRILNSLYEKRAGLQRTFAFSKTDIPIDFPYSTWLDQIERSFQDPADPQRPKFGSSAILGGAAVVVGANGVAEFATALKSLLNVFRAKSLARRVDLASAVLALTRTPFEDRRGIHQQPDWNSWTLARLFGLEKTIDALRLSASSLSMSTSATSLRLIAYMEKVVSAMQTSVDAMNTVFSLIDSLTVANASAQILYVPPVDGERNINVAGQTFSLPNATYGNDGFIRVLRTAQNAPTERYVAGVVILTGLAIPGLANLLGTLGIPGFGAGNVSSIDMQAVFDATVNATQVSTLLAQINTTRNLVERNYQTVRRILG